MLLGSYLGLGEDGMGKSYTISVSLFGDLLLAMLPVLCVSYHYSMVPSYDD